MAAKRRAEKAAKEKEEQEVADAALASVSGTTAPVSNARPNRDLHPKAVHPPRVELLPRQPVWTHAHTLASVFVALASLPTPLPYLPTCPFSHSRSQVFSLYRASSLAHAMPKRDLCNPHSPTHAHVPARLRLFASYAQAPPKKNAKAKAKAAKAPIAPPKKNAKAKAKAAPIVLHDEEEYNSYSEDDDPLPAVPPVKAKTNTWGAVDNTVPPYVCATVHGLRRTRPYTHVAL